MRQKIAVTGANGQLGQEIAALAPSFPEFEFIFLTKDDLPIQQAAAVKKFFSEHSPHYLINCAAYTAVDKAESEKELAFAVNADGPGILAAECKKSGCRFIHISTDYVFAGDATTAYSEHADVDPKGVYGYSKLEGEKLALKMDPGAIIIRTAWVYSEFGKNFVKTMMKLMNERDELNVVNDQVGSPTYAADLAKAIMSVVKNLQLGDSSNYVAGIYHYSNKGQISWYDFAVAIRDMTSSKCKLNPIPTEQYPTPAKRPAFSVLNTEKIHRVFGVKIPDWRDSLAKCIERIQATSY